MSQFQIEELRLDRLACAQGLGQHVAQGVPVGRLWPDVLPSHQRGHQRVVHRQSAQLTLAEEVDSTVAHMGDVTMGIFTFTQQGVDGAIFQMLSHGLISAALFLCVGVVYDRLHTREIAAYGGLAERMPIYAVCFMGFTMANVGLPGTSGFVGEFLTLRGAFKVNTWVAVLATTGGILSAAYALYLYRRMSFGELDKPKLMNISDMNVREVAIIVPLVVLVILFGVYPSPVFDVTAVSVKNLVTNYEAAIRQATALAAQ